MLGFFKERLSNSVKNVNFKEVQLKVKMKDIVHLELEGQ